MNDGPDDDIQGSLVKILKNGSWYLDCGEGVVWRRMNMLYFASAGGLDTASKHRG